MPLANCSSWYSVQFCLPMSEQIYMGKILLSFLRQTWTLLILLHLTWQSWKCPDNESQNTSSKSFPCLLIEQFHSKLSWDLFSSMTSTVIRKDWDNEVLLVNGISQLNGSKDSVVIQWLWSTRLFLDDAIKLLSLFRCRRRMSLKLPAIIGSLNNWLTIW